MKDNTNIVFSIIANGPEYLKEILDWYNKNYGTNFEIVEIIEDEVTFVDIKAYTWNHADIFNIGYQLGIKEQRLRQEGKIDW
jgi:Zn/Cd-binding protein ZinT